MPDKRVAQIDAAEVRLTSARQPVPAPEIRSFPASIPEHNLEDLRERLGRVRRPEAETVARGTQGIGLQRLRSLLDAWRGHDWRSLERRWNAIPHYRTRPDGLNIALWHLRSPEPDAIPLVLTHGCLLMQGSAPWYSRKRISG